MELLILSGLALVIIVLGIYFGVKKCCHSSFGKRLWEMFIPQGSYAPPGSEIAEARRWQRDWLPPADDLEEQGGALQEMAGVEAAGSYGSSGPWTNSNYKQAPPGQEMNSAYTTFPQKPQTVHPMKDYAMGVI